jgi:hypothetical protein
MKKTSGATIYVFVIVSYHVIAGACIHKQSARINNIVGLLKDLKLMCKLDVIDNETHDRERGIFTRCAIECEGLEGTDESPLGSINFASLFATGENYVIRKVKGGVKCLGDILSGGVGMNNVHTICLYALLGNNTFTVLLKNVFNLDMNGLVGDFLLTTAHEREKENNRENYQRNVTNRKDLEQRVSNGDKLDTADKATLSKLMAAHESEKENNHEYNKRNVTNQKDLEQRISNGDKLDTADEATLSKLTAAHESEKENNCENYQRNVTNWKDLEQRISNGDKLDTAEEATFSKLTAAHEREKEFYREYNKRNVTNQKDLEQRVFNGDKLDTADKVVEQTNGSA